MKLTVVCRLMFYFAVIKPFCKVWLRLRVFNVANLPTGGPAIVIANHNSHLDIFALLALFPARTVPMVRPVGAADYFMENPVLAWFCTWFLGLVPIQRSGSGGLPLEDCKTALGLGAILLMFPEGTRGRPEQLQPFKQGVAYLARARPLVPIVPVFMRGVGKALPRGAWLPIPTIAEIRVGPPHYWAGSPTEFTAVLYAAMQDLATKFNNRTQPENF